MKQMFHLTLSLNIPPSEAFAWFTVNERLESWLTQLAQVEPKIGGKYELFWEPSDRENNSTIGCRVTALAPNQLLAFDWKSPKQFKQFANSADPLTHVVITFVPRVSGTDVHVVHSGWRTTPEWQEARQWQERAWRGVLEVLARQVNGE